MCTDRTIIARSKISDARLGRNCPSGMFLFISLLLLFGSPVGIIYADIESDLVGYWPLDGDATDASGNGFDGTVVGNGEWVMGMFGEGILLDGATHVELPDFSLTTDVITFSAWINGWKAADWGGIVSSRSPSATEMIFGDNDTVHYVWNNDSAQTWGWSGAPSIPPDEWVMVALKVEPSGATAYVYSEALGLQQGTNAIAHVEQTVGALNIGWVDCCGGGRYFQGIIDDVRVYARALSDTDIAELVNGPVGLGQASGPQPEDEATDIPRDAVLSWTPGEFAVAHNVYFGTGFDDVNNASPANPLDALLSQGQDASIYDPGVLEFDTTYSWRVDEVNAPPDSTVFKGDVWSFTVEPFSIPLTAITATASSSFGVSVAENTINGSGLVDDLHGTAAGDMWISGGIPATIDYEFDRVYKLHELWIWNSNQLIEAFVGFGAKDVVIEHSLDGENWTVLEGVGPLAQAPGTEGYAHNNTIDFGGATAQHVRVTVNSAQGIAPQASLSEVRFFFIPTLATRPSPASGAADVSPDVPLAWGRDGREADSHEVYLGTDPDNLPLSGMVSESSFDTLAVDLQLSQTYYWRVDEVNETMEPSVWTGDVWSFTTVDAISVDDMESYRDEEFLEIWATWIDGFDDPANGALVGANPGAGDFSPESMIVHGDNQSLPIHYDNGAAAQSEATRTFAVSQDWTRAGVTTLVVWFHGAAGNSGQMYLKINGTKIPFDGPAGNIALAAWQAWRIDLAALGMNLQSIRSLTVGIEGNGATGILYVDDIALVQSAIEAIGQ